MFRKLIGVCVGLAIMGMAETASAALVESSTDLWQSATVTSNSATLGTGTINNMFGATGGVELPNTIFASGNQGSVKFVEWTTSTVTLRSFVLHANHDNTRDIRARGVTQFRLFAFDASNNPIQLIDYFPAGNPVPSDLTGVKYGDAVAPPFGIVETSASKHLLSLGVNITPFTAQKFRAEFVQAGDFGAPGGPRIRELDGFDTFLVDAPSPVPLPAALPLMGTGLAVLGFLGWRRRKAAGAVACSIPSDPILFAGSAGGCLTNPKMSRGISGR